MFFNDLIFIFILIVYSYIQNRFLLYIFNKNKLNFLSDNNFAKPQAFHEQPTYRLGGLAIFVPLLLTCLYLYIYKNYPNHVTKQTACCYKKVAVFI